MWMRMGSILGTTADLNPWRGVGLQEHNGSSRKGSIMRHSTIPAGVPILMAGRHRGPRQGACFMEFASYLAGERWSDHPECTHPLLAALSRDVNDLTSDRARGMLLPLVHRVVGLRDADSHRIALLAAGAAMAVANYDRQRALAVGVLLALDAGGPADLAAEAFAGAPDTERWARHQLAIGRWHGFSERTAEAIVHTSAVGIALACVTDADERLRTLLERVIEDAEQLAPTPAPALEPMFA
jgi:hypothetical protein